MFKTILVPIDMSHLAEGKRAIDIALKNGDQGSQIYLLNVVEEIPGWATVEIPVGLIEKSIESARSELNAIAKASGLAMKTEVRAGRPYSAILEFADDKSADLIVIASHRPGLQDYFLGSTASKVVRHARCSVMVLR